MNEKTPNETANGVARFTKGLLDVMFFGGILATLSLPFTFRWMAPFYPNLQKHYWLNTVLFMLSGVGAVLIVHELRRMFRTVLRNDCFVWQNVVSLRRMGVLGVAIAAVTAVRLIVIFTPATVVIIIVFFIAALFSFVLSHVFAQAVRYKEENDLTI
jgi:predicted membrane channel-forming protein YqfA (hemolysin III family)